MTFKRMITAVDTHSGIPMRVITGGVGHIPGASVLEKMRWIEANDDQLRQLMLPEPRGYPAHCCNLLVPPNRAYNCGNSHCGSLPSIRGLAAGRKWC